MTQENAKLPGGFFKTTILIGFGFFTMGMMDILYDAFVPIFLSDYLESKFLIGSIMTLDNIFALFLIPIVSHWSDGVQTSIGRRMPFIILLLPLSAIAFGLIPFSAMSSLWLLIAVLFILNIFKQSSRGPVVALMPDIIPGEYRSEANGVINMMGGIGAIVASLILGPMMDISIQLPLIGDSRRKLPFLIAAALVILTTVFLYYFVHEKQRDPGEKVRKTSVISSLKLILGDQDKSTVFILLSLMFWFFGYQGMLPFLGLYSIESMGVSEGTAILAQGSVAVAYALFAIPSGIVAHKIGRKRTIRISLIGVTVVLFLCFLHLPLTRMAGLTGTSSFFVLVGLLFFFGIFWGSIITNSFPMLWQMASFRNIGIYTGLYYFFSQAAAILSPPLTGGIADILGTRFIFLFSVFCMIGAFFLMGFVHKGESEIQTD